MRLVISGGIKNGKDSTSDPSWCVGIIAMVWSEHSQCERNPRIFGRLNPEPRLRWQEKRPIAHIPFHPPVPNAYGIEWAWEVITSVKFQYDIASK